MADPNSKDFRAKAEKRLSLKKPLVPEVSPEDAEKLIHELRVHQIELEMQNDELRKAQEEIEVSRSRYADLYDFSPVGYFVFSKTGKILEANLTGAGLVRMERSSLVNGLFTSFIDERFRTVFREHLGAVLRSRGKERCELQLRRKEGRSVFASLESISVKEEDNIRIRSAVSDITDRKRAEEEVLRLNAELEAKVAVRTAQLEAANKALKDEIAERARAEEEIRQSEREFRAIFELSSVGMAQRDSSTGLLIRVNQRLCEMTGYSVKELLNQKDIMLTHPDDRERDREVQAPVFKGECSTWFIEKRYIRKNGEVIWVLVNGRMIRDSAGRPFRTVAVIQEITSRKRAEEEILNLNEQVSKRALDLELANKELDSFTSAVSHDLKNQLIVISAFTERLIKRHMDKLDSKGQEYMRIINSSVENLTALVGDLLELSRLPKAKTKVETLNLSELVLSILKKYQEKDTARQVELLVPQKVEAQGDRRLLTVVLDNLLSNAWKYTKKLAAAQIEFGIIRDSENPIFFVRDNGCGFTVPADSDQVFLPFTRFHKVEEYPGTGVGLATVKRIISRHGGRVWVESSVGKGTIFYFTLQ